MNAKQLDALLRSYEARFGASWIAAMDAIKAELSKPEAEALLAQGRTDEALRLAASYVGRWFQDTWFPGMMVTAVREAADVSRMLKLPIVYDGTARRTIEALRENRLRLVVGFTQAQREAGYQAIQRGLLEGVNPKEVARGFRDSIGLTPRQEAAVANYRRLLTEGNTGEALTRELRDRRFDPSLRSPEPLKPEHIDRMVERYRERMLKYRAETIARTEALRALNAGQNAMYEQAVSEGTLDRDALELEWFTARDERVRASHRAMHGQRRKVGEAYVSGLGNKIRYPGDDSAPAEDTIQCRCVRVPRLKIAGWVEAPEPPRPITKAEWDEAKHPRHPSGDERGGEFAPTGITHGQAWEGTAYRGEGWTQAHAEEPGVYAGSAHGAGTYYGLEREVAERFSRPGTVRETRVRVERPYVVRSDADVTRMREEARRAASAPIDSDVTSLLDGPQGRALSRGLRTLGYDSVIVDYAQGAGGRQVVVLADISKAEWDEAKHPRHPAGTSRGGQFAGFGAFDWTSEAEKALGRRIDDTNRIRQEYDARFANPYEDYLSNVDYATGRRFMASIDEYSGTLYGDINAGLRQDALVYGSPAQNAAENITDLIQSVPPLGQDLMVYRGDTVEFGPPGTVNTIKGFTSTSMAPWVGHDFATHANVIYEIKIPAGSQVLAGFNIDEAEVLLPHGARVRTIDVREGVEIGTRTFKVFHLEYLGS